MKKWIEAMRLRTIPVSTAGVLVGIACSLINGDFNLTVASACLSFAIIAQITANFANEYFDYKNGLDKKGREGFRRGVTEGDIQAEDMFKAILISLIAACAIGLGLAFYGGLWLIPIGIIIALGIFAYSAGPYPLSHHALGDIAVIIFFGLIPVCFTNYLISYSWECYSYTLPSSAAVGILAANVLIVNNYRDMEDDEEGNKITTVVLFGRKVMSIIYLLAGFVAMALFTPIMIKIGIWSLMIPAVYLPVHFNSWKRMTNAKGAALNPLLGVTSINLLIVSILLITLSII